MRGSTFTRRTWPRPTRIRSCYASATATCGTAHHTQSRLVRVRPWRPRRTSDAKRSAAERLGEASKCAREGTLRRAARRHGRVPQCATVASVAHDALKAEVRERRSDALKAVLRVLRGGLAQYTLRQPIGLYYRATVSSQVLERWQATFRDDKLDNKTVRHAMRCDATGRPARCRQASVMRSAQCANASNGNRPRPTPTRKQTNEHADGRN